MTTTINASTSSGLVNTADTSGILQLQTASTAAVTIDASQNVGIGTASPATKAEIYGTAAASNLALRITNTATNGYSTLQLGDANAGVYRNGSAQSGYAGASSLNLITVGAHNIGFSTQNTLRAVIDSSGNVGIGTTSPSSLLHISGSTYPTLRIDGGASYGGILQFKGNDGVENAYLLSYGTGSGSQSNCIIFGTNTATNSGAVERMRINQYGNIALQGGTVNAGGIGITFPASQSASSDANCLDDYEEGTFTPNVGGNATYTNQQGFYTKVGQLVFAQFHLTINTIGTGAANQIYGLPFSSKNDGSAPGIHIGYFATWNTASYYIGGYKNAGDATIILTNTTGSATSVVNGASMLKNGTDLYCSVTYIAA